MTIVLALVVVFVISVLCLFLIVQVFGSSQADFKTVAAAAAIITVVGIVLSFIPVIGGIAALIINVIIVKEYNGMLDVHGLPCHHSMARSHHIGYNGPGA